MKAIKIFLYAVLALLLNVKVFAQKAVPVKKEDKVPNINLGHVLNDNNQKILTSDLAGKLVIIDFWNIHCSSCIEGFPIMNGLQKKFGGKIKIILVTNDKEAGVNALFKRIKPDIGNLTVITDDTLLKVMFPHYGEPHHIWISPEGRFEFATFDHNATEKNINSFLSNKNLKVTSKVDGIYKDDKDLLPQATERFGSQIESYSILVKGLYPYTVGGGVAFHLDSITGIADGFKGVGLSPLSLLKCAYNKDVYGYEPGLFGKTSKMRLVLEVKDSASLYIPIDPNKIDSWQADNFWSFEIKLKPKSEDALYRRMQRELSEAFPYSASIELRKREYLAIVTKGYKGDLKTKGIGSTTFSKDWVDLRNVPFSYVTMRLNDHNHISNLPIIDESGIKYNVDLKFKPASFYNLTELKAELNSHGLDIVDKVDNIPMLVIRDKKNMAL